MPGRHEFANSASADEYASAIVEKAAALDVTVLAITDHNSVAGVPRFSKRRRFSRHSRLPWLRVLLQRRRARLVPADGSIVESGLVEQALDFVRRNIEQTATLEGGRRIDRPTYPEAVLREVIVNALVHRDYRYVDARGMGVRNKVIPGMRQHNGTEPDLMAEEARLIVRLWKEIPAG